ncbi:discoidin domain-containing protein [Humidesulfovibrio idahonensis]
MNVQIASIAGAVFVMTPGYSFMYFQGLTAFMVLLSILLSTASYRHYVKWITLNRQKHYHILASSAFFIVANMIYPSYSFIILPLLIFSFSTDNDSTIITRIQKLAVGLLFFFILSCLYYGIVRFIIYIMTMFKGTLQSLGLYDVDIQLTPEVIFRRTKQVALYCFAMPPLNFATGKGWTVVILAAFSITSGIFCSSQDAIKKRIFRILMDAAIVFAVSFCVILASISPWIFSNMDSLRTRHLIPVYLFLSFAIVWVSAKIAETLFKHSSFQSHLLVLFVILLPISVVQNKNSFLEVVTTRSEIESLRIKLKEWAQDKQWLTNRYILVIQPSTCRPTGVAGEICDKYGNDNAIFASSKNTVSIPWMINAVIREHIDKREFNQIDCGSNTNLCVSTMLKNPHNVIIGYSDGAKPLTCPVQPYLINLSALTDNPVTPVINVVEPPAISVTSILKDFNGDGLLASTEPGWHSQEKQSYPQAVTIDFKKNKHIERVDFLPQDRFLERMPKHVKIETSADGIKWTNSGNYSNICASDSVDGWHEEKLPNAVDARVLRVVIYSNCGDQNLLTLRGIRIWPSTSVE